MDQFAESTDARGGRGPEGSDRSPAARCLGCPGFGIRVTEGGTKTWLLMYRQNGRKVRYTLGRFPALSLADARREASRVLGSIAEGKDLAREQAERKAEPTLGDLAADYLRFHGPKKKPRSVAENERMLRAELLPRWAERKLSDIRRRDVIAMLEEIAGRAPIRANRVPPARLEDVQLGDSARCARIQSRAQHAALARALARPAPERH